MHHSAHAAVVPTVCVTLNLSEHRRGEVNLNNLIIKTIADIYRFVFLICSSKQTYAVLLFYERLSFVLIHD